MSNIVLGNQAYAGQPGGTVPDTLLRKNVAIHIALAAQSHFFYSQHSNRKNLA